MCRSCRTSTVGIAVAHATDRGRVPTRRERALRSRSQHLFPNKANHWKLARFKSVCTPRPLPVGGSGSPAAVILRRAQGVSPSERGPAAAHCRTRYRPMTCPSGTRTSGRVHASPARTWSPRSILVIAIRDDEGGASCQIRHPPPTWQGNAALRTHRRLPHRIRTLRAEAAPHSQEAPQGEQAADEGPEERGVEHGVQSKPRPDWPQRQATKSESRLMRSVVC